MLIVDSEKYQQQEKWLVGQTLEEGRQVSTEGEQTGHVLYQILEQEKLAARLKKAIFIKSQLIRSMNTSESPDRGESDPHEPSQNISNRGGTGKAGSQFEKNYPKNIFIPIIEYLADLGFKSDYERSVGTREQFEGKNVVSLSLIFHLLAQDWFHSNVNKRLLEVNISNKILMNSKIKKKLFHLKVAKVLLYSEATDAKLYKKNVSRGANKIASEIEEDDELFQHPSSIIYLLKLFLQNLRALFKQSFQLHSTNQDSQQSYSSLSKQAHNSKEEFKSLTKYVIHLFNKVRGDRLLLEAAEIKIRQLIQQRAREVNRKYELSENVPAWGDFYTCVVARCFEYKIENQKITNSIFNQWIFEFKRRSSQIGLSGERQVVVQAQHKFFTPTILILPPMGE